MSEASSLFPRSRWITCAGVRTRVFEDGAGPPLLLLHGNPDTHHAWSGVVERLRASFTCYAPDLPGYGESDPQDNVALEEQAKWVGDVIRELGLSRPHLVVHDVGGPYGLSLVATRPEVVSRLTIFNCTFSSSYQWHFWARVWRTPLVGEITMALGNRALFVKEVMKGSPKMPRAYVERAYDFYGKKTRAQVLRFYRYMDPERLHGWEDKLRVALNGLPHQVLWGDLDPYIPKEHGDAFGGEVHHFAELGHWSFIEEPARMAELIRAFSSASSTSAAG